MTTRSFTHLRLRPGFVLGLLSILLAAPVACGTEQQPAATAVPASTPTPTSLSPLESVPASASMLGSFDLRTFLDDPDMSGLFDQLSPEKEDGIGSFEEALETARSETGIDLRKVERAVVFFTGDPSDLSPGMSKDDAERSEPKGGVFLEGPIDHRALLNAVEEAEGALTSSMHRDVKVHSSSEGETAVAVLDDQLFVAGDPESVRAVIDVRAEAAPALSGDLPERFADMGSAMGKLVVQVPPGTVQDALESGVGGGDDSPVDLSTFESLRAAGLSVDKAGDAIALDATLTLADAESATEAADGLSGFVSFFKAFGADEQTRDVLDKLAISSNGDTVSISFEFTVEDIQRLRDSFEEGGFSPSFAG